MTDTSILAYQAMYVVSMYLGTFISYLVPIVLIQRQQSKNPAPGQGVQAMASHQHHLNQQNRSTQRILSMCNCVSAGIFMGICFLNLIPYVDEEFHGLFAEAHYDIQFPVGMFTVILGLFLVLVLETLVMNCRRHTSGDTSPVLHLDDEEELTHDYQLDHEQTQQLLSDTHNTDVDKDESHADYPVVNNKHNGHRVNMNAHNHHNHSHSHSHHMHSHSHDFSHVQSAGTTSISFFILMFATSVHSVFEGLALGLQKDTTKAMHLFVGIILHECLVAFALGLNSARIDSTVKTNVKFSVVFSLTIPVGIVLGVVLGVTPGLLGRSISAVFQGLAAGTFIHVTFHELIPAEFMGDHDMDDSLSTGGTAGDGEHRKYRQKLFKIFLLFVGFCVMAVMTLFTSDSH